MLFVLCTIPIFFFNDTATTEIYTLSLHDALPISEPREARAAAGAVSARPLTARADAGAAARADAHRDRKSTRLNSSHGYISYAVFCLKKKNKPQPLREGKEPVASPHRRFQEQSVP